MQLTLPGFPIPPSAPLTAFLAHRSLTCGPRTLALYRHVLSKFERAQAGRPPCRTSVLSYLRGYRAKAADTQQNVYRVLKAYCRWLAAEGQISHDPFTGPHAIPRPRMPRRRRTTYTQREIVALLTASGPRGGQRWRWSEDGPRAREARQARALVLLLVDSAMRAEEVCRLDCRQARAAALIIIGKGGHEDRAFLTAPTLAVLRELAGERPDDAPLFRDWKGGRCSVPALRGILTRLADRAGVALPPRPLHAFRHFTAQAWARAGLPDLTIKRLMRHADLKTTQIYTDGARDEDLAEQHARVSAVQGLIEEESDAEKV